MLNPNLKLQQKEKGKKKKRKKMIQQTLKVNQVLMEMYVIVMGFRTNKDLETAQDFLNKTRECFRYIKQRFFSSMIFLYTKYHIMNRFF